jgi:putative oxidoreductase
VRPLVAVPGHLVARWPATAPLLLSLCRIAAAFILLLAGTMKLVGVPVGVTPHGGTVRLMSELGIAGILETAGGGLLLLGLFTRPVAFLLSGEMAVAYFQVAFRQTGWPVNNAGRASALFCVVWLYISAAGGGPWSLDAVRRHVARPVSRGVDRGGVEASRPS